MLKELVQFQRVFKDNKYEVQQSMFNFAFDRYVSEIPKKEYTVSTNLNQWNNFEFGCVVRAWLFNASNDTLRNFILSNHEGKANDQVLHYYIEQSIFREGFDIKVAKASAVLEKYSSVHYLDSKKIDYSIKFTNNKTNYRAFFTLVDGQPRLIELQKNVK